MPKSAGWSRDQLLIALRLYMRTPFGKLHHRNPEIIDLAARICRTASALAMKAANFASIDPRLARKGLGNVSQADREIWHEFESRPTQLALEAEEAAERFQLADAEPPADLVLPIGPTEKESLVKIRRVQSFFRSAVMVSYEGRCAVTGLAVPELLVASHIIPWAADADRRADPTNGIILNALLDRAFDRGYMAFDDDYSVLVSDKLSEAANHADLDCSLLHLAGRQLSLPKRFKPDVGALRWHRGTVFKG